jgi:DNA-binding SARP family transcriptional activator
VEFGLLGPLRVTVDGQEIWIRPGGQRTLLAALLLRANRVVSIEELVGRLWDTVPPAKAKAALHAQVARLRRALGTPDLIQTVPTGYRIATQPGQLDLERFDALVRLAAEAGDQAERSSRLADALALWRGEPLADVVCESLYRDVAPALTDRRVQALEQRIDADLQLGRYAETVSELRTLTAEHPLRERFWGQLMTALYRAGQQAEALDAYRTVRGILIDALGIEPGPDLRRVHALVLAAEDDLPAHAGPVVPHQLPPAIAGFTGRAADLAELDTAFANDRSDRPPLIVAVHGPGGAGKTTLALHWAHRVSGRFPGGQVYLDMRGYGPGEPVDAAAALDVVLRAVGVPAARIPQSSSERAALWRTTLFDRRVLLLLDNVRDAGQVRPLLPGAGSVVLVTSRSELRGLAISDGAHRINLGELPVDEAAALVEDVIGAGRAAAEPSALVELVGLCGRMPLALVVAAQQAARSPETPIAELVAELRGASDRLDLLSQPEDPAVDPRVVFSWSYHALDTDAARAFRYLGLHPTSEITVAAAAVLLRTPPAAARRLLDTLASVHLLEHGQRGRYRFHDLLQVYAVERAVAEDSSADVDATRRRILDWYLHTLRQARAAVFTPSPLEVPPPADGSVRPVEFSDAAAATAWYEQHRATLLATVEYAVEYRYHRHGWQLAFLLRHFQETQGHVDDGMRAAEIAVRCAERSGEDVALSCAAYTMGAAFNCAQQYGRAEGWLRKALELSERASDPAMTSTASVALGLARARSGRMPEALCWLERAVTAARRSTSPYPLAHSLLNLGAVQGMSGLLVPSLAHSQQARALYRELKASYYEAFALGNMAEAALGTGAPVEALAYADEALALLGIEDQVTMPETLVVKGHILTALGEPEAARETWRQALQVLSRTGNPRAIEIMELIGCPAREPASEGAGS